jgi:hypothetical protein
MTALATSSVWQSLGCRCDRCVRFPHQSADNTESIGLSASAPLGGITRRRSEPDESQEAYRRRRGRSRSVFSMMTVAFWSCAPQLL